MTRSMRYLKWLIKFLEVNAVIVLIVMEKLAICDGKKYFLIGNNPNAHGKRPNILLQEMKIMTDSTTRLYPKEY